MKNLSRLTNFLLCYLATGLFLALALSSTALEVPAAGADQTQIPASAKAPVKMTVSRPSRPIELLEAWNVMVTIENTGTTDVTLSELRWFLPPQLVATRGTPSDAPIKKVPAVKKPAEQAPEGGDKTPTEAETTEEPTESETWDSKNYFPAETQLGPGETIVVRMVMPDASELTQSWITPSVLSWRYKQLPVTIQLNYDKNTQVSRLSETFDVSFVTPFRTLAYGGLLGALLAMVFYYVYLRLSVLSQFFRDYGQTLEHPPFDLQHAKVNAKLLFAGARGALAITRPEHLLTAFFQMLTASITVIIVLLLLASGNMGILPISIVVNDFIGATFLGLIAHKVGKVTFDAIFGAKSPLPEKPPAITPPQLKAEWDKKDIKARLTWKAPKDAKVKAYKLKRVTKDLKSVVETTELPATATEHLTDSGLAAAGDEATFVLTIQLEDGQELTSEPAHIKRP